MNQTMIRTFLILLITITSLTMNGANAFAPGIDAFLKAHLFTDIFGRGVLT